MLWNRRKSSRMFAGHPSGESIPNLKSSIVPTANQHLQNPTSSSGDSQINLAQSHSITKNHVLHSFACLCGHPFLHKLSIPRTHMLLLFHLTFLQEHPNPRKSIWKGKLPWEITDPFSSKFLLRSSSEKTICWVVTPWQVLSQLYCLLARPRAYASEDATINFEEI